MVDSGAKNVKKFDTQGKFLKTIGREGQGPGELWRKKYVRTKEYGISTLYFPYSADVRWDVTPDGRIINTEFPKHKPVYDNILVDSEVNIWVIHNGLFLLLKTGDDELYRIIRYKITG